MGLCKGRDSSHGVLQNPTSDSNVLSFIKLKSSPPTQDEAVTSVILLKHETLTFLVLQSLNVEFKSVTNLSDIELPRAVRS